MEKYLRAGFDSLGLSQDSIDAQLFYANSLLEKNEVMNLTAITEKKDVATLHFLDSAYIATKFDFNGKSLVDVGTGAGFPGMVLKLLVPGCQVTLLDSLGKRIDWLKEIADELRLENIRLVHARAEEYAADHREAFDFATSRAVASLNVLCELSLPLVKVGGTMIAMKSVDSDEEIQAAKGAIGQLGGKIKEIVDYQIPETEIMHRLVVIEKVKPSLPQFPRSFAKIKKQPLK